MPFQQPDYSTLRLFSPIYCDVFEQGEYGLAEYPDRLNAAESASYQDSIAEMVEACNQRDGNRGLAPYLDKVSLAGKVYSMIPNVEEYGGRNWSIQSEAQLKGEPEQDFSMRMQ